MSEGIVTLRKIGGNWAVIKEDDTDLGVTGSVANRLQTAIDYADDAGCPLNIVSGRANPLIIQNASITFPPQLGNFVRGHGAVFEFPNNGSLPGFIYDTQAYGAHDFLGARTYYNGAGPAAVIRPNGSYDSGGVVTRWMRQHVFDLGTIFGAGGNPSDLLLIDPTQVQGSGQFPDRDSTQIADILIRAQLEGWNNANYGARMLGPIGEQNNAEITFQIPHIESCRISEIYAGVRTGTCQWFTNITHGWPSGVPLEVHGEGHQFYLASLNILGANGPSHNAVFGPTSRNNLLVCGQVLSCPTSAAVPILDQGDNNKFDFHAEPILQAGNFEGTSGTPSGSVNMATFTYVDRSWAVDNGKIVTKLWLNTTTPGTYPLKIVRRNSAGDYDVVASQLIAHGGGGLESVTLTTPYAVANDGKEYFVGVYTSGVNHPALDQKPRAYSASNIGGNNHSLSEQAANSGWYVLAVGVTYQ